MAPADKPFRLIAISWPADRIGRRQRPDAQIKAHRSEVHGYYLAWLLDQIDPTVPVGLFGMSYGPRMITSALHYLGGGSINGHRLDERVHPVRKPVRVVLMAAALDAHWLNPGQRHGKTLTQVQHALIMVNHGDRVLYWYPHLYRPLGRGPQALGSIGMSCRKRLSTKHEKVVHWNVGDQVGRTHRWTAYEGSMRMTAKFAPHLFD